MPMIMPMTMPSIIIMRMRMLSIRVWHECKHLVVSTTPGPFVRVAREAVLTMACLASDVLLLPLLLREVLEAVFASKLAVAV